MSQNSKPYYQMQLTTPLGPMLAIADEQALCSLEFYDRKKLERQIRRLGVENISEQSVKPLDSIAEELALYFAGKLKKFNTPLRFIGTVFQQQVWQQLQKIPFGKTRAYLQIAEAVGKPTAYRAVANANGANHLAIVVPCHRVINANQELGGYAGGLDRKIWLLNHEGEL